MTMHLMRGFTSLNTRKPVVKMTKAKLARLKADHIKHNQFLKSIGTKQLSFDQYVDYVHGRGNKTKVSNVKLSFIDNTVYRRTTQHFPSLETVGGGNTCSKKESMKYTGTKMIGIGTLHKSNAVPIFDDQQAKDISRMRRG